MVAIPFRVGSEESFNLPRVLGSITLYSTLVSVPAWWQLAVSNGRQTPFAERQGRSFTLAICRQLPWVQLRLLAPSGDVPSLRGLIDQ